MRMQTIEVDEEIYTFLQDNAKPFIDSPNSVLRRLLLLKPEDSINKKSQAVIEDMPFFFYWSAKSTS